MKTFRRNKYNLLSDVERIKQLKLMIKKLVGTEIIEEYKKQLHDLELKVKEINCKNLLQNSNKFINGQIMEV